MLAKHKHNQKPVSVDYRPEKWAPAETRRIVSSAKEKAALTPLWARSSQTYTSARVHAAMLGRRIPAAAKRGSNELLFQREGCFPGQLAVCIFRTVVTALARKQTEDI